MKILFLDGGSLRSKHLPVIYVIVVFTYFSGHYELSLDHNVDMLCHLVFPIDDLIPNAVNFVKNRLHSLQYLSRLVRENWDILHEFVELELLLHRHSLVSSSKLVSAHDCQLAFSLTPEDGFAWREFLALTIGDESILAKVLPISNHSLHYEPVNRLEFLLLFL